MIKPGSQMASISINTGPNPEKSPDHQLGEAQNTNSAYQLADDIKKYIDERIQYHLRGKVTVAEMGVTDIDLEEGVIAGKIYPQGSEAKGRWTNTTLFPAPSFSADTDLSQTQKDSTLYSLAGSVSGMSADEKKALETVGRRARMLIDEATQQMWFDDVIID
jgi:hypothetical protein